jgi:AraC family transcriptional regulator
MPAEQFRCRSDPRVETTDNGRIALSPIGWPGVPIARLTCRGGTYTDLQIDDSVLVLHESSGADVEVRRRNFNWKFTTRAGSFDFYPAGEYESFRSAGQAMQMLAVTIPSQLERLAAREARHGDPQAPRFQFHDHRLRRLLRVLLARASAARPGPDEVTLSLSFVDRLHELMAPPVDGPIAFSPMLHRLLQEHLDRHLSAPVDVETVAALTGLARTQFTEAFRDSFGLPLHQYVVERRISHAKQQLLAATISLTELALQLGFASHAHFSTVFKNRVGVTPSQFRNTSANHCATDTP